MMKKQYFEDEIEFLQFFMEYSILIKKITNLLMNKIGKFNTTYKSSYSTQKPTIILKE